MTGIATGGLALWGLSDAPCTFVAGRENRVYRVETPGGVFALRIKRPGYRSEEELLSELQWLDAMDRAGLSVPRPEPSLSGALLETFQGHYLDLVCWLPGAPLGKSRSPLELDNPRGTFRTLGREMARLHLACDVWDTPRGFTRCHWDVEGLLGDDPLWGRFWENPTLDAETRALLETFRHEARRDLAAKADLLDYDLIHADLVRENVLLAPSGLSLIDFDDGGYGYRLFDIATALLKNRAEPDYEGLREALLTGYTDTRPLDTRLLGLFMALRAVTYLGWIVPRMGEEGSPARNQRFIQDATDLCGAYLGQPQVI